MKKWKTLSQFIFRDKNNYNEKETKRIIEKWENSDKDNKNNWEIKIIL